ncbi:hypothetical protein [Sulfurovum sp.]|uniref:hypothetical protein n=1 Tax=Sulfurovum sp. TaxID=1969726 RepID=UPI0025D2C50A|nr:hypothetical protein [Sulfurovum sp.]
MKKLLFLAISAVAVLALSGCGGSSDDYYIDEVKYHVVDQDGYGVADIRYTCDGNTIELTDGSGGFYFYPNDDCSLQLELSIVDSTIDDLFIENDAGGGVSNISYECTSSLFGRTDIDGHFEFDNVYKDDICTFQL